MVLVLGPQRHRHGAPRSPNGAQDDHRRSPRAPQAAPGTTTGGPQGLPKVPLDEHRRSPRAPQGALGAPRRHLEPLESIKIRENPQTSLTIEENPCRPMKIIENLGASMQMPSKILQIQ